MSSGLLPDSSLKPSPLQQLRFCFEVRVALKYKSVSSAELEPFLRNLTGCDNSGHLIEP